MGKRLFVSIDLAPPLHDELATLQERFASIPGVSCTDPTQAHVTLKFLGDVDAERKPAITAALERAIAAADVSSFVARFGNLGVFPEFDYISVIWVGVPRGGSPMAQLHDAVERELGEMGFEAEEHTFTPHVTIARMEHGEGKEEVQQILQDSDPTIGEMAVSTIALTESTLTDDGPQYEPLERVELP